MALDVAMEFATAFKAELILVHVVSSQPLTDSERQLIESEYQTDLQQAARSLRDRKAGRR